MLERRTVVDQVEISLETGETRVRLAFLILDGGVEISRRYHRTAFDKDGPETHVNQQMAEVNAHLQRMNELPVSQDHIGDIRALFALQKARRAARQ